MERPYKYQACFARKLTDNQMYLSFYIETNKLLSEPVGLRRLNDLVVRPYVGEDGLLLRSAWEDFLLVHLNLLEAGINEDEAVELIVLRFESLRHPESRS